MLLLGLTLELRLRQLDLNLIFVDIIADCCVNIAAAIVDSIQPEWIVYIIIRNPSEETRKLHVLMS